MPKLLQITAAYNCGAPGKIVEQIGLLAKNKGWEVYAVHGVRHSNPSQLITLSKATPMQERFHALMSYTLDGHGLGSYFYTKKVIKKIEEFNPDIIHLHNLHGYYINYPILFQYFKKVDKPIVWTFHDFWPITGHCVHFDYNKCDRWKTGCHHCGYHKEYPFSFIDCSSRNYKLKRNLFTGLSDVTLIPVSNWVGSLLSQSFLKEYPIQVIHNGVDTKVFYPKQTEIRKKMGLEGKFVLLGVSSPWSEMKGFADYVELNSKLPNDYSIVMVGLTQKQISDLPEGIVGIERTQNQDELVEYYSMADVVLNLSYQETFGMTTVEGMSCGTPSIVYDKTASPELVTPETGIVVELKDFDGLMRAIFLIKEKGKSFYSLACRKRVEECFDKDKRYEEYVELYQTLLR